MTSVVLSNSLDYSLSYFLFLVGSVLDLSFKSASRSDSRQVMWMSLGLRSGLRGYGFPHVWINTVFTPLNGTNLSENTCYGV
jgi:hypothetical protein